MSVLAAQWCFVSLVMSVTASGVVILARADVQTAGRVASGGLRVHKRYGIITFTVGRKWMMPTSIDAIQRMSSAT